MSEVGEGEIEEVKVRFGINNLCEQCDNYKKTCKGIETVDNAILLKCGKNTKYKKKKRDRYEI